MKSTNSLLKTIFALAVVLTAAALCAACGQSSLSIDSGTGHGVTVTAQKAGTGTGGLAYLTLGQGQVMQVRSELDDKGCINIKLRPADPNVDIDTLPDLDFGEDVLLEVNFSGAGETVCDLPAGDYDLLITVTQRSSGVLAIEAADK